MKLRTTSSDIWAGLVLLKNSVKALQADWYCLLEDLQIAKIRTSADSLDRTFLYASSKNPHG